MVSVKYAIIINESSARTFTTIHKYFCVTGVDLISIKQFNLRVSLGTNNYYRTELRFFNFINLLNHFWMLRNEVLITFIG